MDITGLMMVQMIVTCVPVLATMGFSAGPMAALIGASTLAHAFVWNSLHPAMHGLNEVPSSAASRPSPWPTSATPSTTTTSTSTTPVTTS